MNSNLKAFNNYLTDLQKILATGKATEPSYYSALKSFIESAGENIIALNNPKLIDCGAPDFIISKGNTIIGYVEAKDIDKNLDEAEKPKQMKRYCNSLTNLILTDYLARTKSLAIAKA